MDNEDEQIKDEQPKKVISAFEPQTLIVGLLLSVLTAGICMQMIGKIGSSPNTSILGAVFAMIFARIPIMSLNKLRSVERQNLIQTTVSAAGFAASNCGFVAVAIMFVMGKAEYIMPMALGAVIGSVISVFVIGNIFDSDIFPAQGAWPPGVATAATIEAGDQGGEKCKHMLQGLVVGLIGSYFKIPVAGFGMVFIAKIPSMVALGTGLVIRGYSTQLFGFNLGKTSIPQGIMIGAGLMALVQCLIIITRKKSNLDGNEVLRTTVSDKKATKSILASFGLHFFGGLAIALLTGIFSDMSVGEIILWLCWTGFSATVAMLLVGMAAMRSGWFPGFAVTTIFMTFGIMMGFSPFAVAVMTGYISTTGPCFADMGFDLKAGWILRGKGKNPLYELAGRKEQVKIEAIGAVVGILMVMLFGTIFMKDGLFPPISKTFVTTIMAGSHPELIRQLAIWSIPGILLQLIFGTRMVGVLFATGLILNNPIYGVGILVGVIVRLIIGTSWMEMRSPGLIAGDGIYGLIRSVIRTFF